MTTIRCQRPECPYTTGEHPDNIALALFQDHSQWHAEQSRLSTNTMYNNAIQSDRPEKVKKPPISLGSTPEDWSYFITRWDNYKEITNIKENSIIVNLMECCEETLRKDLFRTYGNLKGNTEEEALNKIKKVAVRTENVIFARVTHHQMKQDDEQPVRSFVAKLKGQAGICNYIIRHTFPCGCNHESDVSYADAMVRTVLASGLADNQIQRDLFCESNQEMPLEQMINFIETKEVGNRSVPQATNTVKTFAVRSTYKRDTNQAIKTHNMTSRGENRTFPCGWCGKRGHGNHKDRERRRRVCPAFEHICKNCDIKSHYESVCKGKSGATHHRASTIYTDYEDHSSDRDVLMGAVQHRTFSTQGQ